MKLTKIFGLTMLVMLIGIACNNSPQSQVAELGDQTTTYDVIEETNDGYRDAYGNYQPLKLVRTNRKIGFICAKGEVLFPCTFDSVVNVKMSRVLDGKWIHAYFTMSYDEKRYAKVKQDGKWGLVTIDGKTAIPCIYDEIYDFEYSEQFRFDGSPLIDFWDYEGKTAVVKKNGKWGLINTKGELFVDCIYDEVFIPRVMVFYHDLVAVKKNGLYGFLNKKGESVTSFAYEAVGSTDADCPDEFISTFSGGMAVVKKNGRWGAIDSKGNEKIPFIYDYIFNWHRDFELATAQQGEKWGYINKKGEAVIPIIYDDIKWFERDLCPVKKDGLWGFLNERGEIVVPMMYDDILVSEEVEIGARFWFFSRDKYCAVKKNGKWGVIDKDNNIVVNFEYDEIKFYSSGLGDWRYFDEHNFIAVRKGKFWSIINKDGINHIPFEYDDVEIWSEGNVCVKRNGKWGLVDSLGRQLVPIEHQYAYDAGNYIYNQTGR
ncbi:MAG: WG repeat-containing protein [Bacteroidales bacterium]|nr:WG repeat-containing protein [Bacteroidales bacterium]